MDESGADELREMWKQYRTLPPKVCEQVHLCLATPRALAWHINAQHLLKLLGSRARQLPVGASSRSSN
jgi:hypothetical protein